MYTLVSGFYKYMLRKDEFCVLILGLDNAGKTTYLESAKTKFTKNYKGMNPSKITTTVGLNIGQIDINTVRLNFWDLGGQLELQSLWDKVSFIITFTYFADKMISNENLIGVPLLVLANKQDIRDCMGVREVKPIFNKNSAHLIGRRDCMVMPVSALTGEGIDEGIRWLVECIKRNCDVRPPRNLEDT
ncbi:ADP-ribosylation factor-related protein 1 [Diaphorina citri]|uniref:ADP-ribosylation factor-related protein 1 n=1 Tax=Diaphorina citri TaxID=121845 RepID=A0A3Q0J1C3_DIACI|nr:ADP-ribosylation factor-related protein 1 [Diaphorina citri]